MRQNKNYVYHSLPDFVAIGYGSEREAAARAPSERSSHSISVSHSQKATVHVSCRSSARHCDTAKIADRLAGGKSPGTGWEVVEWTVFLSRAHIVGIFGIRGRYDDKALARVCWWNVVKLLIFDTLPIFGVAAMQRTRRNSGLEGETEIANARFVPHVSITFCCVQGKPATSDPSVVLKYRQFFAIRSSFLLASKRIAPRRKRSDRGARQAVRASGTQGDGALDNRQSKPGVASQGASNLIRRNLASPWASSQPRRLETTFGRNTTTKCPALPRRKCAAVPTWDVSSEVRRTKSLGLACRPSAPARST
jgi:hypothetical protein